MPKRRAHGEGALFRRNKGRPRETWVARITLEDATRKDVYAKTQAEAKRKLHELQRAAELGLVLRSERQTVGQFLIDWLENAARPKLRPRSFAGYRTIVQHYLVPRLGYVPLTKLTPQHVQAFQNELLATPLSRGGGTVSSGTVINARRVLGRAMEQATRWGLIARNPVRLADGPHLIRKEIEPLDSDQARRRLAAIRGDRLEALYTVALTTTGGPIDPEFATRSFQKVLKREGLPHQWFHDLRHACASLLLAQGLDLQLIQEILGHSTITITADLYAHVMMGAKRQAASRMDAMLGTSGDDPEDVVRPVEVER